MVVVDGYLDLDVGQCEAYFAAAACYLETHRVLRKRLAMWTEGG
jgi:hypothetical protein